MAEAGVDYPAPGQDPDEWSEGTVGPEDPWEMPRSGHAGRAPTEASASDPASVLSPVPPWQKHLMDRFTRTEGDTGEHLLAMRSQQVNTRLSPRQKQIAEAAGLQVVEFGDDE